MFNDLKVSSSIVGQVPSYYPAEYPNFVNFLKDYYRFLETNGNPLDLLNGVQDLIDVDTYTGIDASSSLKVAIDADDKEIVVAGHVVFPRAQGLLKIDDEVIIYNKRSYSVDGNGDNITTFDGCTRGFTYNNLTYGDGFTANNETTPAAHSTGAVVFNQSFSYILYFLEELRSNYLIDFPSNILTDNIGDININQILKNAKDFYLSKGTPSGIDFYFNFLFQKKPELRNYKENLYAPSEATFQNKNIVRLESLDTFFVPDLVGSSILQKGVEYPVQTAENVFSFASQVYEFEISNGEQILPTNFTVVTAIPETVGNERRLYVDSTFGFPEVGVLRINQDLVTYTGKRSNYFECGSDLDQVVDSFQSTNDISLLLGDIVYDNSTLATAKNNPGASFVVYVGISDVTIETNNIGYQTGDLGFVSNVIVEDNLIVSGWEFNDTLPLDLNESLVAGVTKVYTDDEYVYMPYSTIPFYDITYNTSNSIIKEEDIFVKIPKVFEQSNELDKEDIPVNSPVGILRDGTPLLSWKSATTLTRGELESVTIIDGGSNFNVHTPPSVKLDGPTKLNDADQTGVTAEVSLGINGSVRNVYIKNKGEGYDPDTVIVVTKNPLNDPNVPFRDAVLRPLIVDGKISKVRIVDPGTGYTHQPTVTITPDNTVGSTDADIEVVVTGPIYKVNIDNPGSLYTQDPEYQILKGDGAAGLVNIENGKLLSVDLVNGGQGYKSAPKVTVVDKTGGGIGAEVVSTFNAAQGIVTGFTVTNSGLNYNEFNTSIVISEEGSGEILEMNVQRWNLLNNWDSDNVGNYNTSDGSLLLEGGVVDGKTEKRFTILGSPKKLEIDGEIPNLSSNPVVNQQHSPIIGWALDGSPIYGPYGFEVANDASSAITNIGSGYSKLQANSLPAQSIRRRSTSPGLLANYPMGSFAEDYVFTQVFPVGLDSENGRFCVTPEFPNGVYAYFTTINNQDRKQGFPFFVGPKFKGKTQTDFNILESSNIENVSGLKRYLTPGGNAYHKPTDTGNFIVDSIPSSTDAAVDSVAVLASGVGYKLGDILAFNNEGTGGFGAAAFVSTIKGQTVTSVSKATYDYLEYDEENIPFASGSTIQTVGGFSASVYSVDQKLKRMYLTGVTGGPLQDGDRIFDTSLTVDVDVNTEVVGSAIGTAALNNLVNTAELVDNLDSVTGYIRLQNYNLSGTIALYTIGKYIKIEEEYCKIIQVYTSDNAILVRRGVNETTQEAYAAGTTVTLTAEIPVFDSTVFEINDIISVNTEKFKIIDIDIFKDNKVVSTKIVNGGSSNVGTFYLFFDGVLQTFGGQATQVVQLGASGEVEDLTFDAQTGITANPKVQIGTLSNYNDPNQNFLNVEILASAYNHKLIVERTAFSTGAVFHYPRTVVNRLRFINGLVVKYEEDRILAKLNSANNQLVQNDFVKVSAALQTTNTYNIQYNSVNNPPRFEVDTGNGYDHTIDTLEFYEGSTYTFNVPNINLGAINIEFYGPSYDAVTNARSIGRKYFDVNINRTIEAGNITKFTIFPDDSDLTDYIMRISHVGGSDYRDYTIRTISEPINGEYNVVNSSTTYFEIYTKEDPLPNSNFVYDSNTISYITRSLNATGGINTVTLTSGGFNYTTTPVISSITTVAGEGAILEPVSDNIGKINNVKAVSSGYGYSPDATQKPSVIFPRITKIKNNFIVSNLVIDDPGSQYIFAPRIVLSGGGIPANSTNHAIIEAQVTNGRIIDVDLVFPGIRYNSAPIIDVEKYYYAGLTSSGELSFKFAFNQYILENDIFKFRAYYEENGVEKFVDSSINFYAKINSTTISAREQPVSNNTPDVNPLTQVTLPGGATPTRYELISLSRKASVSAIVSKSQFISGEKVTINGDPQKIGFVTNNKGWQQGSSILRIENYNYLITENDEISGSDSGAFGIVESAFGISAVTDVGPIVQTPKKFLDTKSFLSSSALRLQDSYRYQKFAYEIGTEVPFVEWKEGYQKAAHPTGYNLFARTAIDNVIGRSNTVQSIVNVSTNVNEVVSFRTKYNYLVTKNNGLDEVEVKNRLLTDVKNIKDSVVAAFEDISLQFDGIENAFELKVVDPVTPTVQDQNGNDVVNYIENYDIDQMVVLLDNIIQTYGTSWIVTDADKTIRFTSNRDAGELMPPEVMHYRQFNDDTVVYHMCQTTTVSTDTFDLVQNDSTVFPSGIFSSVDEDNYMVFIDGVIQLNSSFAISGGGGSPTIQFTETLPIGSELSIRYLSGFLKNEFTSGTVTAGTAISLSNKPSGVTSKQSYFVFVDGIVITTDDYEIDGSNDLVFDYDFSYDTLIVIVDPLGVSLEEQEEVLLTTKYDYKVNDGQLVIPVGFTINPEDYLVEIAGVTQTPYIVYETLTSGIRKINFFEPPQRYEGPDRSVGRQFIGLLYQRSDADGSLGTTQNYQFDDVSKNIIHTLEPINNFIIGDFVINSNELASAVITDKSTAITRVVIETGHTGAVAAAGTFDIVVNDLTNIFVGDRVKFKASHGMTSNSDDELQISAINSGTRTITLTNISSGSLTITMAQDTGIRFLHHTLVVEQLVTDASITNRDNSFTNAQTVLSGLVSSQKNNVITSIDEVFGVSLADTAFDVVSATGLSQNDYIVIDNTEIVKITNISSNTLTVTRSQLNTNAPLFHGNGSSVQKITPYSLTVQSFNRGFDGQKTEFVLKENGNPVAITADKDIFVIVNGILQKRGSSYNLVEVDPDGTPGTSDEFSKLVFTEAPSDGTPFNCFYVGEQISIRDISNEFNGIETAFDLRDVNGEIFSLISNGRAEANISANLILFIDGVYQIPSTTEFGREEAYPESLSSFKLFGSLIEFSAPPKFGSEFEGYIFVGSPDDYESIDVDATVEAGDTIVQSNEVSSRGIINVLSATRLATTNSQGQRNTNPLSGINPGTIGEYGWWLSDLIKEAKVRESLRSRRTLTTTINSLPGGIFPLSGTTLYTTAIASIVLDGISSDLPNNPDDDTNLITFALPATTHFGPRRINARYTTFVPRNPSISGSLDEIQGVKLSGDLAFDQIVELDASAANAPFLAPSQGSGNGIINESVSKIKFGVGLANSATVINWDATNRFLYVKLDNPANVIANGDTIQLQNNNLNTVGPVTDNDLIAEYQSLTVGNELYYNF